MPPPDSGHTLDAILADYLQSVRFHARQDRNPATTPNCGGGIPILPISRRQDRNPAAT